MSKSQCVCGNSFGEHESLDRSACACDAYNVGKSKSCVFQNVDESEPVKQLSLQECPAARREAGELKCTEAFGPGEHSDAFLDACVLDFCFGGAEFVDEDAAAEEMQNDTQ